MGMYFDMTGIDHQPLEIRLLYHRFQHFFPDALVSPATETPLDSIPLTIFRRQVSPWCSRSQNPEHAIQKLTGILCVPSPRSLVSYCVRLENFPHRIGHIVPSIAVLHEETPLCVFLHYTTKRHFCRQCLAMARKFSIRGAAYFSLIRYIRWHRAFVARKSRSFLTAFVRNDEGPSYVFESDDLGESWSEPMVNTAPIGNPKIFTGRLSDGRPYAVYNQEMGYFIRSLLVLAVGDPHSGCMNRVYRLFSNYEEELGRGSIWFYPCACEVDGSLCIGATLQEPSGVRSAVMAKVPISSL